VITVGHDEVAMDLKRIRYALALAQDLNFARAAEKLHLSQPALSRGIQALEEELGLSLFDRDNRTVSITKVGELFLERARRIAYEMRMFELDMAQIRDGQVGHVAFGVGPSPTYGLVRQVLREVRRKSPGICFTVDTNNWRHLLLHLRAEEIEFFAADTREISPESDLVITPLCRQYGSFFCRPGHPLLGKPMYTAKDLLFYGFALISLPNASMVKLRHLLGLTPDQTLPVALKCDNLSVLKELAINDDLILGATQAAVERDLQAGRLVSLPFPEPGSLFTEIGIVHLSGRTLSPAAALVLNAIRTVASEAPATSMYEASGFYDAQ
jgi:DNA-binding transcriptional LysR family regulator